MTEINRNKNLSYFNLSAIINRISVAVISNNRKYNTFAFRGVACSILYQNEDVKKSSLLLFSSANI